MSSRLCWPSDRFSTQSMRHLDRQRASASPPMASVEAALAELRLALRVLVHVGPVVLEHVEDLQAGRSESASCSGWTKSRLSAEVWYSGKRPCGVRDQAAHGQIEAGRAVLALVVAVGRELRDRRARRVAQDVRGRPVDLGVPAAALLVREAAAVAEAGEDEAVADPAHGRFVARQPGDRADRPGDEQEPVRVAARRARRGCRPSEGGDRDARRGCRWRGTDGRRGTRSGPRPSISPGDSTRRRSGSPAASEESMQTSYSPSGSASSCALAQAEPPASPRSTRSGTGSSPAGPAGCGDAAASSAQRHARATPARCS